MAILVGLFLTGSPISAQVADYAWHPDQRLTSDPGASRTTFNFGRSIAVDESGRVHAVWYDARHGQLHIYYRRSTDQGGTWAPEQRISRESFIHEHPSIAVAGASVYIVWHAVVPGQGPRIHMAHSSDNGQTWAPPQTLTTGQGTYATLAVVDEVVHLVWTDTGAGGAEIQYRQSLDGGLAWDLDRRLTNIPYPSRTPSIAADENLVALAWVDTKDDNEEEYVKVSTDGGQTWGKDTRITKNRLNSWAPSVSVFGESIHLVWFDQKANGVGLPDAERQLDEMLRMIGVSFTSESVKKTQANVFDRRALQRRIQEKLQRVEASKDIWHARSGDPRQLQGLLLRFQQTVDKANSEWEIYYRRSENGGHKWEKEKRLTKQIGMSSRPNIAVSGSNVHLVWSDNRGGRTALYYMMSTDNGKSWAEEVRLTDAAGGAMDPSIAVSGNVVHVLWYDTRDGNAEVYYKRYEGN